MMTKHKLSINSDFCHKPFVDFQYYWLRIIAMETFTLKRLLLKMYRYLPTSEQMSLFNSVPDPDPCPQKSLDPHKTYADPKHWYRYQSITKAHLIVAVFLHWVVLIDVSAHFESLDAH